MNNHGRGDISYLTHELNLPPEFLGFLCFRSTCKQFISAHSLYRVSLKISGGKLNTVDFRMK